MCSGLVHIRTTDGEHRRRIRLAREFVLRQRNAQWIEHAQPCICCHQKSAATGFQEIINPVARQSLLSCVIRESVAVEMRKAPFSAEPKGAARVAYNSTYLIAHKPVGYGVSLDW